MLAFVAALLSEVQAQKLLTPSFSFSHKKTAYITLKDGTELKGNLKDLDYKKGLIKSVKLKDGEGKKHKLKPSSIKHMYLPQSNFDKLNKITTTLHDAQMWSDETLEQNLLKQGYIYFENSQVKIKKKTREMLMQLLNPGFCKSIRIYNDPFAKKTASAGIGGVTLVGGIAKSYYIAKDGEVAFRMKKKMYRKEFTPFWGGCQNIIDGFPKQDWSKLVDHVIMYTENCGS